MATRRKEIGREELTEAVAAVLRQASEPMALQELRAALADEEGPAVQASPGELAEVLNALIVTRAVGLSAYDTDVPVFRVLPARAH